MKNKNTILGITPSQSGALFINNIVGVSVFFTAASISLAFFPLYLGYAVASGAHVYERGAGNLLEDIKIFIEGLTDRSQKGNIGLSNHDSGKLFLNNALGL